MVGILGLLQPFFEPGHFRLHGQCMLEQLIPLRKLEVIDDIDEQQRSLALIRSAPVKIRGLRSHIPVQPVRNSCRNDACGRSRGRAKARQVAPEIQPAQAASEVRPSRKAGDVCV